MCLGQLSVSTKRQYNEPISRAQFGNKEGLLYRIYISFLSFLASRQCSITSQYLHGTIWTFIISAAPRCFPRRQIGISLDRHSQWYTHFAWTLPLSIRPRQQASRWLPYIFQSNVTSTSDYHARPPLAHTSTFTKFGAEGRRCNYTSLFRPPCLGES